MVTRTVRNIGIVVLIALGNAGLRADATDAVGSLLVESDPVGASVFVDGRLAGETPLTLPAIAPGVHRVRIVRLGYLENSRLVTVKSGTRATLRARLTDPAPQTAQAAALKIVVVEGEGAVNIIQQKTAVAPVIEVRDRNDQPVSGAVVRFAISKGRASFNGARTLSVTTNAAGRATAAGLTPTGSGALQIGTSVAFQGQTAVATIAQVNVLTAAQAASASAAAASSTGAAGGGGLSTTTLAVVGGAVAGGTLVATKVLGNDFTHYTGPFSGLRTVTTGNCSVQVMHTGTVSLDVKTAADGTVSGSGAVEQTRTVTNAQGTCGPNQQTGSSERDGCCNPDPQVQGTTANLTFNGSHPGGSGTNWTYVFTGALTGAEITGTFTETVTSPGAPTITASFPVSLR